MRLRRQGYLNFVITILACLGLLIADGTANAQERMKQVAPLKAAPSQIQKMAPAIQRPAELDVRPDLTLGACKVECSRGGDYSEQVCQQYGYSDQFTYRVKAQMSNAGKSPASIESGWCVWGATHQSPGTAAEAAGSPQIQGAPTGGIYLVPETSVPGTNSPILYNMHDLAPGVHRVVFTADPENHVSESDEGNNSSQCEWTVVEGTDTAPYDFAITHLSVAPQSGPPSTQFHFSVTVKNLGGATFYGLNVSCQPGTGFNRPGLDENESYSRTLSIPGTMTPGTKTITCTVNSTQPEEDTSNNTMTATFTVTQP